MENLEWYEMVDYDQAKAFLGRNITDIARSFVSIGYWLKYIQVNELYKNDGYKNIWEFAQDQYGISRTTASRYMDINNRFSKNGNSPILIDTYKDYTKSKLQEMLYLTDEQMEDVTPDMTVKEIREIRQKEEPKEEVMSGPKKCITGQSGSGYCGAAQYCNEPVQCCAACKEDCNGRCGWIEECATSHIQNNEIITQIETIPESEVKGQMKISDCEGIVPEGITIIAEKHKEENVTPQSVLAEENKKLNEWLEAFEGEELPAFARKQQIIVDALNKTIIIEPEQPELPVLKNNEQRKEWLVNYKKWGLWYEDCNTGARYYKYDFENGARLIAETYKSRIRHTKTEFESCFFHLVGGPEPPKRRDGIEKWTRNERYNRYPNNTTELVEFLKEVQNGGR